MNRLVAFGCLLASIVFVACEKKNDPRSEALVRKGVILMEVKQNSEAMITFNRALKYENTDELSALIYRNISILYQTKGKFDSALVYSQKGYEAALDDSYLYYMNKAEFHLLNREVKKALDNLQRANKVDMDKSEVYTALCSIYSGAYGDAFFDPVKSEYYALKAYHLSKNIVVKEQLASVYFQNEKYAKAKRVYKDLIFEFPDNQLYNFYYGESMFFLGNENEGLIRMRKAADRDDSCKLMFQEIFESTSVE
jgi:tetratricopeptide (TPR) repeat protein